MSNISIQQGIAEIADGIGLSETKEDIRIYIDYSGSTRYCNMYWNRVKAVVDKYPGAKLYFWDTSCRKTTLEDVNQHVISMWGYGGTDIRAVWNQVVADVNGKMDKIVILTDGQVDASSVDAVVTEVDRHGARWVSSEVHMLTDYPNTSVPAPFISGVPFSMYDLSGEIIAASSIVGFEEMLSKIQAIMTPDDLDNSYNDIYAMMSAFAITKTVPLGVREALVEMRARIVNATAADTSSTLTPVEIPTVTSVLAKAVSFIDAGGSKTANADRLIAICSRVGSFSINDIKASADKRTAANAPEPDKVESVQNIIDWEDPIMMDSNGMPALVFMDGSPLLVDPLMLPVIEHVKRNPLFVLSNKKLLQSLVARMLRPLSVAVISGVKGVRGGGETFVHPETRELVMGKFAVFGEHKTHNMITKSCLAKLFFGGDKLFGSYHLWMIVLWAAVRASPAYVSSEIGPTMDAFIVRQMDVDAVVPMGLDPTGSRPMVRTSLREAFMYVLSAWTEYSTDSPTNDPLRELYGVYGPMRAALDLVNAEPLPGSELYKHTEMYVADLGLGARLLRELKQDDEATVVKRIASGYTAKLHLGDGSMVLLDAASRPTTYEDRFAWYLVTNKVIHAGLTLGNVKLGLRQQCLPDPADKLTQNFSAFENAVEQVSPVVIHPRSMRPLLQEFVVFLDKNGNDAGVPVHRRMVDFFIAHGRWPIVDDEVDRKTFILSLENKHAVNGVLPLSIDEQYATVSRQMHDAMARRKELYGDTMCSVAAVLSDLNRGHGRVGRAVLEAN